MKNLTNPTMELTKQNEVTIKDNFRINLGRQLKLRSWTPHKLGVEIGTGGERIKKFLSVSNKSIPQINFICNVAAAFEIEPSVLIQSPGEEF